MINVLIVDDSAVVYAVLKQIMQIDGRFHIVGHAKNGQEGIELNKLYRPDLIIMDINMPVMDGIEATRQIMATSKPVIIVFTTEDTIQNSYKCIQAGALDMVQKPNVASMTTETLKKFCNRLASIIEQRQALKKTVPLKSVQTTTANTAARQPAVNAYDLLLIGASTGGPIAIQKVLQGLPTNFPLPILITQHIDASFDVYFAKWLKDTTGHNVQLAQHGQIAQKGNVYVAPANSHLTIKATPTQKGSYTMMLDKDPPMHFLRPAVDKLFISAAPCLKERCFAVLLTGMGKDGAEGCLRIKNNGGFTIAESEKTCVVFGMPRAAIECGGASTVLPLQEIPVFINKYIK
ncbi:MAG: chemotaxis-specific protein-glutamate methyltransferase CheB [Treponema sp.]|nr:chemotaxis-specific protein-glutamate methyltransferase CheB [Treponema sp.]